MTLETSKVDLDALGDEMGEVVRDGRLLVCPFCGKPGVLFYFREDDYGTGIEEWEAGCENVFCDVMPRTLDVFVSKDMAIGAWNKRMVEDPLRDPSPRTRHPLPTSPIAMVEESNKVTVDVTDAGDGEVHPLPTSPIVMVEELAVKGGVNEKA